MKNKLPMALDLQFFAEEENAGENVETATTQEEPQEQVSSVEENTSNEVEKTFTQKQVDEIIKSRLERANSSTLKKFGVNSYDELEQLLSKNRAYDELESKYNEQDKSLKEIRQENYCLKNNIKADRYDDVKAYFKGKELEFTEEELQKQILTHPEWVESGNKQQVQIEIGNEHKDKPQETEKEYAERIFGIKF